MTLERQILLSKERIKKNTEFLDSMRDELDGETIETLQTVIDNELAYLIKIEPIEDTLNRVSTWFN